MISQAPIKPGAGSEQTLYTTPAGYESVIASIIVCNTSSTDSDTFRLRKSKGGAATDISQSQYEAQEIGPGETFILSPAYTLTAGDLLRVRSVGGNVTFDINGTEVQ